MSEKITRKEISVALTKIARNSLRHLPNGFGIAIIIAPVEKDLVDGGDFVSDLDKKDAIKLIRDTADRLERNLLKSK